MANDERLHFWQSEFSAYISQNLKTDDGSHDLGHFNRVWKTAQYINEREGNVADLLILLAAAYFHDFISFPKNDPRRSRSSLLCAERTAEILDTEFPDFPKEKIAGVKHAIHAHSFSAQVTPETMEAQILQDADRMEALGAIGLARTFYVSGSLHTQLFDAEDPLAEHRVIDDKQYALDHFEAKLLKLPALMNTATGKLLARERADYLADFRRRITQEIRGEF